VNRSDLAVLCDRMKLRLLTRKYFFGKCLPLYQPLPFASSAPIKRFAGCESRLAEIRKHLKANSINGGVVVDYGCNIGFFSLALCKDGFIAYGVEEDERSGAIGFGASRVLGLKAFCPIQVRVTLETVAMIPDADVTLCLSIWHHWVRAMGFQDATRLLKAIYARTRRVLFFDTGEKELARDYGLPFANEDPRPWLEGYLARELGGTVQHLGYHKAFAPGQTENDEPVVRSLFAVMT